MATIKEIALETGFSPSTVSIVLRGKAEDRNISEKTKTKILDAAKRMDYRVNIAARRLRANQGVTVVLSVFMALDRRANMMTHFLLELQRLSTLNDPVFDITIHSYESGSLHLYADTIALTHMAIICNASDEDVNFLNRSQFSIPIVLFLRKSKKYCTVGISHRLIGSMVADIFARRGHKHAVILGTKAYFIGMTHTENEFTETAKRNGLATTLLRQADTMPGGHNGGMEICKMRPLPDCVFVVSTSMAIGALRAFSENGVKIPQQVELICVGTVNPEIAEYANPSLSAVQLPIDLMAKECVRLLFLQLSGKLDAPHGVEIPFSYMVRDSCGG